MYNGGRSRSLGWFWSNSSLRLGIGGRLVVAPSVLVNHEEGSEEVEFIVLSDVVVELLQLDDHSGIVLHA